MTGLGVPIFEIVSVALFAFATTTVALAVFVVRLGTMLVAVAVAVSVMVVPDGVPEFTCRISVNVPVLFTARVPVAVQVIVPVPPTGGVVPHVHPAGAVMDWKFVFGGVTCVNVAPLATAGPLFVTVCVYVTLLPEATEPADGVLVTIKSACVALATMSAAVALLFAVFESVIAEAMLTVSLIAVPGGVPAVTRRVYVIVPEPGAKLGFVQVRVPGLQVHPAVPVSV